MAKVICDNCGKEYQVHCSDLDWEIESYEKHSEGMGAETHYNSEWNETCDCGDELIVNFFYVVYPEGVLELDNTNTNLCSLEGDCSPV